MILNTQPPSSRLRNDLNELVNLARLAPPDECGWGWEHHAQSIQSALAELDGDFAELLRKCRE